MKRKINSFIFYIVLFLSFLIIFSTNWVNETFGLLTLDSLLFHLTVPLKGTSSTMVTSYITKPLLYTVLLTILIIIIFSIKYNHKIYLNLKVFNYKKNNIDVFCFFRRIRILLSIIIFIISLLYAINNFGIIEYVRNMLSESKFIEENYVEPEDVNITFPNKKSNLIYILVESFENTFADTLNGGAYEENLIPYMTKYMQEEISFTNTFGGGFYNSRATGWTIAAMVAQSSGVGFYVPGNGNEYGKYSKFLPGAYSLGDLLNNNGYNQTLLIGSDADFAGRKDYYVEHGNYNIKDYYYAIEKGWIDKDYNVWWGYEDSKLFEFAKLELEELSKKDEPFNLTMLTTNTHHIGGYLDTECEMKYEEQLKNVISCTDKQLYDFIEWIKEQDFYKNTTIVVTGDHLSMEPEFFNNLDNYTRTNYNVFINSVKNTKNTKDRVFNTLDIYPTIVSSLGGKIEGNKLGLGTDLFSDTKTLYEEYGINYVEEELSKNSTYLKNHVFYGIN